MEVTPLSGLWLGSDTESISPGQNVATATVGLSLADASYRHGERVQALITVAGETIPAAGGRTDIGGYEVWIEPSDDYGGNQRTPSKIAVGETKLGRIDETGPAPVANAFGEEDWFRIQGGIKKDLTYVVTSQSLAGGMSGLSAGLHTDIGGDLVTPAQDYFIFKSSLTETAYVSV